MSAPSCPKRCDESRRTWLNRWLLPLVLSLTIFLALPAAAAPQAPPANFAEQPGISPEQAANISRRQTGGRVLSVTPVKKSGQRGYNIRVLIDGKRVKQYYVDSEGRMSPR